MTEKQAQKTFDKYNPANAVTRCPNGRTSIRKMLDIYAQAAVNLYGIISKAELADIFNRQNTEQTTADEIFTLLLPIVLKTKNKWYCFYKDYIVHYWAIDDFDYADYWLNEQGDKPRFIPDRSEFLKFENQYYESASQETYWEKIYEFIKKEWFGNHDIFHFYLELKSVSAHSSGFKEVTALLEEYNLIFRGEKQAQAFFSLLMDAGNNTRMWSNKGYTPNELRKILEKSSPKNASPEIVVQKKRKIGQNEPCPCGSGKKYKKCCRLTEESQSAQLSHSERRFFYETWYKLLDYINRKLKVIDYKFSLKYLDFHDETLIYKIRERLWKEPKLISQFISDNQGNLSEEEISLLQSWEKHHIKQMFFVVDYKPEYAVVIGSNKQKQDRLYGVKGMTTSIAEAMKLELPIQFETVLLPFKDKIIYDSFMNRMPIGFAEGAKQAFREMYDAALVHGIITSLEDN